ncbi:MAG: hypothetical protein ACOYIR_09285, partial [Christensenellales bacterium]
LGRRFTYFLQGKALFPQLTKAAKAPGVKISHHRDGSLLRLLCFALKPLFGFIYYNISHFHFEETFLSFFDQNQCPAKNAGHWVNFLLYRPDAPKGFNPVRKTQGRADPFRYAPPWWG